MTNKIKSKKLAANTAFDQNMIKTVFQWEVYFRST